MITNILTAFIVETFNTSVGKFQCKKAEPKAYKFGFNLSIDHDKEDGYRTVEMALYAEMNYVGVYTRETWDVIPVEDLEYNEDDDDTYVKKGKSYNKGATPWTLVVSHDSGWTSAVYDFIILHQHKANTYSGRKVFEIIDPKELSV